MQARESAEYFSSLIQSSDKYKSGARRFDVGQKGTPTILPGVIAALDQIKIWGVDQIADSLLEVNSTIAHQLTRLGFQIPEASQRSPHMFGAIIPTGFKGNLVSELSTRKIFVSQRGNSVRVSPHLNVTDHDLNHLPDTLERLIR